MAQPSAAVLLLVQDPDRAERALPQILPGRDLKPLRREELRLAPLALVRRLRSLEVDELVVLTDDLDAHERLWRIQALGAVPIAPRRYLQDLRGRRLRLSSSRFAVRDLPALACGLLLSGPVLIRTRRSLDRLLALPRHSPDPAAGRNVCFLRSDLWSGIPAGGSVAHTAGVAQGFSRIGADLFFIGTSAPPLVDPDRQPVHLVPPRRIYNVFREVPYFAHALRFDREARLVLARRRADLIYHRFDPSNHSGVLRSRHLGVPLVLEFNGSEVWVADHWDQPFRFRTLFEKTEAANLRHADLVVVVSDVLRESLLLRGVEKERVLVQPNGVDPERYHPALDGSPLRRRLGLDDRVVVGFIGTFGVWHGAPVLARAARRVLAERPEARFLFVGDGKDRRECEAILADQGGRVVFTGAVPQEEGPEHLAAMDILAAPHVENRDGSRFFGSPTKLFEYMAMGRGIVASRLEQIGEVLQDAETALLVPPGDEEALARALIRLIDDPDLRRGLGAAARRRALRCPWWGAPRPPRGRGGAPPRAAVPFVGGARARHRRPAGRSRSRAMEVMMSLRHPLDAVQRLKRRADRTVRRLRDRTLLVLPGEADLLRAFSGRCGTLDEVLRRVAGQSAPFLPEDLTQGRIRVYYEGRPEARERLIGAARNALDHRFDLLGSGPVTLGAEIPWHADFRSRHGYDASLHFEDLREQVAAESGSGREVRIPRELSRCQHLPLLGQAFRLTSDPIYFDEFRRQAIHWIGANAVGFGVNWTCTMDVAIRAVNWIWAWVLFREEVTADREFAALLLRGLLAHGRFIARDLEGARGPGSHEDYASLLGLLFLGVLLRGAPEADDWRALATSAIEEQNDAQTYADGADYEASIASHRLMTEMTLTALILMERSFVWRPLLHERARRMADFVAHYLKPSGMAPQVGDNDGGRLQILGEHGADRRDHRSLLAVAGSLFNDPALLALAEDRTEEALWLLGPGQLQRVLEESRAIRVSMTGALFPHAGLAVLRHGDLYALLDAGTVGLRGQGAFAHNDTLSVELQAGGEDLIVDPGTGCTSDLTVRNAFRSTAAHNTVRVDGEEINPLPSTPTALPGLDRPAIKRALFRRNFDLVEAEHEGYMRLEDPVRHRRVLLLNRVARHFVIEDRLDGMESHRLEWFFHLAPGAELSLPPGATVLRGRAGTVRFALEGALLPGGARLRLAPDRFSAGYGLVEPSQTLVCDWEGKLPVTARFVLSLPEPMEPAWPDAGGPPATKEAPA